MTTMEPEVLYEDDEVLVINKPAGMMVHEDGVSNGPTVVEWFLRREPKARGVGEPGWGPGARLGERFLKADAERKSPPSGQHRYDELGYSPRGTELERSGVVHRLDRETSGVLILAKTQAAHQHLKAEFHDRRAKKEYRAFVYGRMNEPWGTIARPIGRSAKDFRKRSAEPGAKGVLRDAVTEWETIGSGEYEGESFSYVKLIPKTGRTHQLRVHLKAIDRPIVGDRLYAGKRLEQSNNLGFTSLALHAHTLELTLPSGEAHRFIAPVPPAFDRAAELISE